MSKAEEKSQNRYPTLAEKLAFIDGYKEAEKDLELTWEDISNISECLSDVEEEITVGQHKGWGLKEMYQEALKRFNKERNKK